MTDESDWIMRPVIRGMCRYESLKSGKIDLVDLALMNEALDVQDANEAIARESAERKD